MTTSRESRPSRAKSVVLAGVLLYLVSWLVPVIHGQELFGAMGSFANSLGAEADTGARAMSGPDWLPGWSACRFAWGLLTERPAAPGDEEWKRIVLGATCLTNAAMAAAILLLAFGARPRWLGVTLLACAVLDASWPWLGGADLTKELRAGYWLWLASFLVTGLAWLAPAGGSPRDG